MGQNLTTLIQSSAFNFQDIVDKPNYQERLKYVIDDLEKRDPEIFVSMKEIVDNEENNV